MTDLHTHILCGVDDGAATAEISTALLRQEWEQGVRTVVLTPHYYWNAMSRETFLQRREQAWDILRRHLQTLPRTEQEQLPEMLLGAEVAWGPDLQEWPELPQLCMGNTGNLLLELPFSRWPSSLCETLNKFMSVTGITPVLAHLERYLAFQSKAQIRELLSMELPVQISANLFSRISTKRSGLRALRSWAHVVASDCHDPVHRPANLGKAMAVVEKRLGTETVRRCCSLAATLASK